MDGRMDGWMDGWMDGVIDEEVGLIGRWMNWREYRCVGVLVGGWAGYTKMDGQRDQWMGWFG